MSATIMSRDNLEIVRVIEEMTAAFQRADLPGVLAAYDEGAAVAFEPGKPASGGAALEAGFEMFFTLRPRFSYGGHDVIVAGDTALHIAPWRMTGTTPDGRAVSLSGLSVAVLRRGADGDWRMVIDNPFGGRLTAAADPA